MVENSLGSINHQVAQIKELEKFWDTRSVSFKRSFETRIQFILREVLRHAFSLF